MRADVSKLANCEPVFSPSPAINDVELPPPDGGEAPPRPAGIANVFAPNRARVIGQVSILIETERLLASRSAAQPYQ